MDKPRYIRFKHFSSERDADFNEAQRLIKLKKEIRRLKRQRLAVIAGACTLSAVIVYLVAR